MDSVRVAEIGQQLLSISRQVPTQIAVNHNMADSIRRAAVALFEEAISLGALNAPQHGLIVGLLAAIDRGESHWHWHYFLEANTWIRPDSSTVEIVKLIDPALGAEAMGNFLISIAGGSDGSKPGHVKGKGFPANYYDNKFGIPVKRLDSARRSGRLAGTKQHGRWLYLFKDVKRLWPDDFDQRR